MKTFYIDFSGYFKIKAEDEHDAESKFWNWVSIVSQFSGNGEIWDDVWDIDNIELVEDENEE